jgi:hypothetical protein
VGDTSRPELIMIDTELCLRLPQLIADLAEWAVVIKLLPQRCPEVFKIWITTFVIAASITVVANVFIAFVAKVRAATITTATAITIAALKRGSAALFPGGRNRTH